MRSLRREVQVRLKRQGSVPLDNILNRALRKIEQIQKATAPPKQKQKALEEAMMIYQGLQKVAVPERQDYNPNREMSLEHYAHSGGLGYHNVSWKYMGAHAETRGTPKYDEWFRSPAWSLLNTTSGSGLLPGERSGRNLAHSKTLTIGQLENGTHP